MPALSMVNPKRGPARSAVCATGGSVCLAAGAARIATRPEPHARRHTKTTNGDRGECCMAISSEAMVAFRAGEVLSGGLKSSELCLLRRVLEHPPYVLNYAARLRRRASASDQ